MKSGVRIVALGLLLQFVTACGLFKRSGAVDPNTASITSQFAAFLPTLPPASNLTRESSETLKLRMQNLFPTIQNFENAYTYSAANSTGLDLFLSQDWDPNQATGLAATFDSGDRPSDPVSMTYWNQRVFPACDWYLGSKTDPSTEPAGAVFSSADVLMAGENLPSRQKSASTYWAFLAARNVFLYPYAADSVEVQTLAQLYDTTLLDQVQAIWKNGDSTLDNRSPEQIARLAVCVAALSAPQFMLGNPGKVDVIRKLAYTLGRRRPTFSEISDFTAGKLDLRTWVAKIQETEGYFAAIGQWHKQWLGQRPFIFNAAYFYPEGFTNNLYANGSKVVDLRYNSTGSGVPRLASFTLFSDFYNLTEARQFDVGAINLSANQVPFIATSYATSSGSPYEWYPFFLGTKDSPLNYLQDFDPRTAIVSMEFASCPADGSRNFSNSDYVPKVAYILKDAYEKHKPAIEKTLPGFLAAAKCALADPTNDPYDRGAKGPDTIGRYPMTSKESQYTNNGQFPSYYFCVTDPSVLKVSFDNSHFFGMDAYYDIYHKEDPIYYGCNGAYVTKEKNASPVMRLRRFSPTILSSGAYADQNGLSTVKTWVGNESVLVSNTLSRFVLTCAFRPDFPNQPTWIHAADYYVKYLDDFIVPTSYFTKDFTLAVNPYFLNQFRCGNPNLSALNNTKIDNDLAYPFAYNHLPASYSSGTVAVGALNSVINTAGLYNYLSRSSTPNPNLPVGSPAKWFSSLSSKSESGALLRLQKQIEEEPENLLRYILKNKRSYGELFTARYTVGGPELELFYRTQGYYLPAYPDAAAAQAAQAGASGVDPSNFYRIELAQFNSLRANYLQDPPSSYNNPDVPPSDGQTSPAGKNDMPQDPAFGQTYYINNVEAPQYTINQNAQIPPRSASGVLTMPAFLAPQTVQDIKLRSIAHRIFLRLLCGEPNVVTLKPSEQSIHAKHMSSPTNPAPTQHLDPKGTCFGCHVNMDPLAAALGFNFLNTVQTDYQDAGAIGEFYAPLGPGAGGQYTYGVRAGPFRGTGAFLGKEILPDPNNSGFQQVGEILVGDIRFASCITNTTFTALFGRGVSIADAKMVNQAAQTFLDDGLDFNRLIQDLAASAVYDRDN